VVLQDVVKSFVFLYLGLLLLFVFVLDSLVYGVGVCLAGKPLPLVSQEDCCVAFLLYSLSTSWMSGVDTLCAHASPPASCADRQSSSSAFVVLDFNQLKTCFSSCGSVSRVSAFGLIFFVP